MKSLKNQAVPKFPTATNEIPTIRIQLIQEQISEYTNFVTSPEDAFKHLCPLLAFEDREVFGILMLDTKSNILGWNQVSVGVIDQTFVSAREVFKAPILANSNRIIMAHNHPSGDPTPSSADYEITNKMTEIGEMLGIEVLDHMIIGAGGREWTSIKRYGGLKKAS